MAGQVHRASGGRSARRAADPEMAERRRAGGWETNTGGGRNASGRKCFAAFGERLSSLRVRPVDPSVASKAGARRCYRRAPAFDATLDRKSQRLNSNHRTSTYAVFRLNKKQQ